jgi:hypothetical protein
LENIPRAKTMPVNGALSLERDARSSKLTPDDDDDA